MGLHRMTHDQSHGLANSHQFQASEWEDQTSVDFSPSVDWRVLETQKYLAGGAITILKNDGVRQWVSDNIPYMKWKIKTVPNHQPAKLQVLSGSQLFASQHHNAHIFILFSTLLKDWGVPTAGNHLQHAVGPMTPYIAFFATGKRQSAWELPAVYVSLCSYPIQATWRTTQIWIVINGCP